jgi:hypothetical protein
MVGSSGGAAAERRGWWSSVAMLAPYGAVAAANIQIAAWVLAPRRLAPDPGLVVTMAFTALCMLAVDVVVTAGTYRRVRSTRSRRTAGLAAAGVVLLLVAVPAALALALR